MKFLLIYTFAILLLISPLLINASPSAIDPAIEANHIRRDFYGVKKQKVLSEEDIAKIELSLDDDLINFSKFKGKTKNFKKIKSSEIKYRSKKIIKKGALLFKDSRYYFSPRSFVAVVSHNPKNHFSSVLNAFDQEEFQIRNIDLSSTNRLLNLNQDPERKIDYPKKLLSKKYYDQLPILLKIDLQTELFKEGYLDELSGSTTPNTDVPSIAAGLGISLHLVTNYDFILNFGLSSFFHTGTWLSRFEKTIYQSLYVGPEILLRMGSIEGLNIYGICELTRSLINNISSNDKSVDLSLRNSSIKFGIELKSSKQKSTWYTGAYYRLIESSLGRESSSNSPKPRYRQNSNAYGLYFGRTFDFFW